MIKVKRQNDGTHPPNFKFIKLPVTIKFKEIDIKDISPEKP